MRLSLDMAHTVEHSGIRMHLLKWGSEKFAHRLDLLKGQAQALRVLRPLEAGEHTCKLQASSVQHNAAAEGKGTSFQAKGALWHSLWYCRTGPKEVSFGFSTAPEADAWVH